MQNETAMIVNAIGPERSRVLPQGSCLGILMAMGIGDALAEKLSGWVRFAKVGCAIAVHVATASIGQVDPLVVLVGRV